MNKYGLFVDGSNLFASAKSLDFRIDYVKLLNHYKSVGEVAHAFYFTALPPKDVPSHLRPMVDFVRYNGYKVIEKETKDYADASGVMRRKGNMDVEIAVYAAEVAQTITHMVLFSGDADFCCLIESMQRRHNIHCTVVSSRSLVANSIRSIANEFTDLNLMRTEWSHEVEAKVEQTKRSKFLFGS